MPQALPLQWVENAEMLASVDDAHDALKLKQISYFITLADYGSISAAANALNMAQPSLSENIAKLERQLDVQLAIRGSRGVQMTEAGMLLVDRGRDIIASVDSLISELRLLNGEPRGPVSIALPPSLSIFLSVPLLETMHSEYPEIRVHVAEAMSGDILEWVANDRVDVGCVYEISDSTPFSFEPLLTEELFLVAARDNWDDEFGTDGVAKTSIQAAQLKDLPLVLTSPTHGARKLQEKFARAGGFDLNVVAAIDSLPHIVEMVSRASAYSILSHGAVTKEVASGAIGLIRISDPALTRTAYMVRKRSRPVSRASAVTEDTLTAILRELVDRYDIQATLPKQA